MIQRLGTLAERLGLTIHESSLRRKLLGLQARHVSATARCLEDWLVDVANARGATVVFRPEPPRLFQAPPLSVLSQEELVVGLCQLQCLDRPQILRLAAQLISRGAIDPSRLVLVARRERAVPVLAALTTTALRVEPAHPVWSTLAAQWPPSAPLRDVLLHWTRLAEPQPVRPGQGQPRWRLAA